MLVAPAAQVRGFSGGRWCQLIAHVCLWFVVTRSEYDALRQQLNDALEELHIVSERERKSANSLGKLQMMSKSQTVRLNVCAMQVN